MPTMKWIIVVLVLFLSSIKFVEATDPGCAPLGVLVLADDSESMKKITLTRGGSDTLGNIEKEGLVALAQHLSVTATRLGPILFSVSKWSVDSEYESLITWNIITADKIYVPQELTERVAEITFKGYGSSPAAAIEKGAEEFRFFSESIVTARIIVIISDAVQTNDWKKDDFAKLLNALATFDVHLVPIIIGSDERWLRFQLFGADYFEPAPAELKHLEAYGALSSFGFPLFADSADELVTIISRRIMEIACAVY